MADKSKIEWTDATWNPVIGCTKCSPGCDNCYAERMCRRFWKKWGMLAPPHHFGVKWFPDRLDIPLHWRKPRKIFVCSLSDLFHPAVPRNFIAKVLDISFRAYINKGHVFQFLTKRPKRMEEEFVIWSHLRKIYMQGNNGFWLGVSVSTQKEADEKIPILLKIPAALRFVSIEPMLEGISFKIDSWQSYLSPCSYYCDHDEYGGGHRPERGLDWVIVGGESGPKARPMHPDWVRSIRDQCRASGVPFFFKQWGEWMPGDKNKMPQGLKYLHKNKSIRLIFRSGKVVKEGLFGLEPVAMQKVGKKKAGRMLDGKEYMEYPK